MRERNESIVEYLEDSGVLFKNWKEVDLLMSTRPEKEKYQRTIHDNTRSIIFSLYRVADVADSTPGEDIVLAKKYLNSLVYESFSILQYSLMAEISVYKEEYETDVIKTVFPKYFDTYLKEILLIQQNLPNLTQNRDKASLYEPKQDPRASLDEMWADVIFLRDVILQFKNLKPAFEKKTSEDKKKSNSDIIKQVVYIIIAALLGWLLSYFFSKPD
ncbi:hypothetical protein WBJ53_05280 [Spirosoma sp. SC4-14]|uniref:hypothetical protein n=1 Tax=Spirosoma sp. SC4-14 TaxID=3128900 RepID=UPI0030CCF9DC